MSTPTDPYNASPRGSRQDDDQLLDPIEDSENDGLHFSADDSQGTPRDAQPEAAAPAEQGNEPEAPRETATEQTGGTVAASDSSAGAPAPAAGSEAPDPGERVLHAQSEPSPNAAPASSAPAANSTTGITRTSVLTVDSETAATTATGSTATYRMGPTSDTGVTRTPTGSIPPQDVPAAAPSPTTPAPAPAGGFTAAGSNRSSWSTDPGTVRDIPDAPKRRTGAHFASVILLLLLIPVAWYLVSDAGARLNLVDANPWQTGTVNVMAILELVGGLAVIGLILLIIRSSSLGAQIWGALLTIGGIVALALPNLGTRAITYLSDTIGGYNDFTGNVVHHLNLDLGSGRIAVLGFVIFMTGVACHISRREGERNGIALGRRRELLKGSPTN